MRYWCVAMVLLLPLAGAQGQDLTIESHDGTPLNARLYLPQEVPAPAILLTHGWGESIESGTTRDFAERYQALGYVVLAYDSRGFGQSGGQVELAGPNEVADVSALIDHLASLDAVLLDAPGDPRLGMVGQSYAGGIQVLAAGQDRRIDAIAPFATWSNLLTSLAPNDVLKRGWIDLLYASGTTSSRGIPLGGTDPAGYDPDPLGGTSSKLDEWYLTATATNAPSDEMRQEVGVVRSYVPGSITAPVFLAQGWPDTLFTPDHALATFQDLRSRGVDARLALFHGGHGGFGAYASTEPVMAALDDFFAQHLRDQGPNLPPYPVLRYRYHADDFVGETSWPPAGSEYRVYHLTDEGLRAEPADFEATLVAPAAPTQCTEISNFQSQTASFCGQGLEGTRIDVTSEPLEAALEVTGTPYLRVEASTTQTQEIFLFFHLEDIAPDGSASPVLSQVMPVRVPGDEATIITPMATVSHLFDAGHQIALTVATTDLSFHGAREAGQITLGGAEDVLLLPVVPQDAWGDRMPPRIASRQSFGSTLADAGNETEILRFTVTDDLGLGNVTLAGAPAHASLDVSKGIRQRLVELHVPCGGATYTLVANDLAGNEARHDAAAPACAVMPAIGPEPAPKKTPLPLVLAPLLAALAMRRPEAPRR